MLEPDYETSISSEVVCTELQNGEAVLLHLGTKSYFTLNSTGLLIWQLLEKGHSVSDICQQIEARYDVSPQRVQECVDSLIGQLAAEKLILIDREPSSTSCQQPCP